MLRTPAWKMWTKEKKESLSALLDSLKNPNNTRENDQYIRGQIYEVESDINAHEIYKDRKELE